MKRAVTLVAMSALVVGLWGCASKAQTGALVGAGSGAVIGAVVGKAAGNTAAGAVIGAAVGGAAGAIIGGYMDRQAAEMERDLEGARIERIRRRSVGSATGGAGRTGEARRDSPEVRRHEHPGRGTYGRDYCSAPRQWRRSSPSRAWIATGSTPWATVSCSRSRPTRPRLAGSRTGESRSPSGRTTI